MAAHDIYELMDEMFGCKTDNIFNPELASLTNVDAIVLRQDPRRIAFNIANLGAATIFVNPTNPASATAGFPIAPGGVLGFTVRDDYALPAIEWHIVSPGGNQSYLCTVVQIRADAAVQ